MNTEKKTEIIDAILNNIVFLKQLSKDNADEEELEFIMRSIEELINALAWDDYE